MSIVLYIWFGLKCKELEKLIYKKNTMNKFLEVYNICNGTILIY